MITLHFVVKNETWSNINLVFGGFKLCPVTGFLITTQLVFIEFNLIIFIILMILFQLPDKLSVVH